MFTAVIRRAVQPSLRQTRPYVQSVASPSSAKLEKGEQEIYDKLSERFQPSDLLVQDVSGTSLSAHTLPSQVSIVAQGGVGHSMSSQSRARPLRESQW